MCYNIHTYVYIYVYIYMYIYPLYIYMYIYIYPRQPLPAPAVQRTLGACSCNLVDDGAGKTTKMGGECEPERRWFITFQERILLSSTNSFHCHFNHQLKGCTFTSSLQQISEGELQPRRDSHGQFDETSLLRGWAWYGDMPSTRTFFLLYKYRPKHTHICIYIL